MKNVWRDAWLDALREKEATFRRESRGDYGTGISDVTYEPEGEDSIIMTHPFLGLKTRMTIKVERID